MKIKLLRAAEVPMAHWVTHCECCGPVREYPDVLSWYPEGEEFDPDEDYYHEIDLEAHKDTFKFGVDYTIVEYP